MNARTNVVLAAVLAGALAAGIFANGQQIASAGGSSKHHHEQQFTDEFFLKDCNFTSTGSNRFFILEPNYQSVLIGREDGQDVQLIVTVKNETKNIDGVQTRVVEERETHDGKLAEISDNYFAMCEQTNSVFYFGEDTKIYENGKVVGGEEESWHAGADDAKAGVFMPGIVLLGARYQEETAPDVAMDRAEIISLNETVHTSDGNFDNALRIKETTPLEPGAIEYKYFAAEVGIIQDGTLKLEHHGFT
jgi:hypothetical protein